jgi:CubicO group peptidase (beta-lactamase class C family)
MMLYEEGKFLLDDPLSHYIPEFAKPVVLDKFNAADSTYTTMPAKSEVTIRQLLTHTSASVMRRSAPMKPMSFMPKPILWRALASTSRTALPRICAN